MTFHHLKHLVESYPYHPDKMEVTFSSENSNIECNTEALLEPIEIGIPGPFTQKIQSNNADTTTLQSDVQNNISDSMPLIKTAGVRVITMEKFLSMELPKREMLLSPILPEQGLALLFAKRGVGKTHVALGISYAVASGGRFLKWEAPRPRKVLYIDGEMPATSIQERLRRIAAAEDKKPPSPDWLRLITPDVQERPIPDLSTREGQSMVDAAMEESDLIILDNISCLFRTGVENEAESWQPVQEWALNWRRRGKSILFVHHAGKNGLQRGSSKKEDILDVIINLKQPASYRQDQGASFEVIFEKTRHFAGEEAASFLVQLRETEDGLWCWDILANQPASPDPMEEEIQLVADMLNRGLKYEEIEEETGLSKSKIETRKRKAKSLNLIN